MDYTKYTDEELITLYHEGETGVLGYLSRKYENMVWKNVQSRFLKGGEDDDLFQEGMIGFIKAVNGYKSDKNAKFSTFAETCISRAISTAVTGGNRNKNIPLNSYISIYDEEFKNDGGLGDSPLDILLDKERVSNIEEAIQRELSSFEIKVIELKIEGMDYTEIATVLSKSPKSVDNAIQRVKSKLKEYLKKNE